MKLLLTKILGRGYYLGTAHGSIVHERGGLQEMREDQGDPPSLQWTPMLAFWSWRGVSDEYATPGVSGILQT